MFDGILPAAIATEATRAELDVDLYPAEMKAIANAVEKRRREFVTGRACARAALAQLGVAAGEIPPGPKGEPLWPDGVVGSIAHCQGFRGAAVGSAAEFATIGIDAEPNEPLPDGVLTAIALPDERARLRAARPTASGVSLDRLLFCAKESVYKAWYPLAGTQLGFEDATVILDVERKAFEARLLVPGPVLNGVELRSFEGSWTVSDGIVLAAIALSHS